MADPVVPTQTDPIAGVRIWESNVTVNNRNVILSRLSLRQINSIYSADVANFQLVIDGEVVATVASLDANGYVSFTFNKTLQTGVRNVKVLADINGGSGRLIQMSLRNKADIDVKDSEYNVNIAATGAVPGTANPLSINQGVFTITADNAALPVTVANGASNILIGKWKFKATGEAVKVETLTAGFGYADGGGGVNVNAAATLRNGKIMIDGVQYGSTTTLAPAGTAYTINYTFQPGVETVVALYADIFDNDGVLVGGVAAPIEPNDTIQGTLVAGVANGTKQVSLGTIAVPTAAQVASTPASVVLVAAAGANLVATPSYGTQNTVLPRTAFKVGSWTLTAGTTEDINVNTLTFAIAPLNGASGVAATELDELDMSDMYVVYKVGSGSAVTSAVRPTPIAANDFSVSFVLPKTQTATIELYSSLVAGGCDVNDSLQATLTVAGTGSQSGAAAAIAGSPKAGQEIVYKAASLTITRDASTPAASLVAGNTTVKTVSYKFEATNDSYTLLQLIVGINNASSVISASLKEGSTVLQTITGIGAAPNSVTFNVPVTLTADTPKVLDVELTLGSIAFGMGTTGADITTDYTNALVRPTATGVAALTGDVGVAGNPMYVYRSVPTIGIESLPTTLLTAGTKTLQKFTAGSATSATNWKQVIFSITRNAAGATIDNCKHDDGDGVLCTGLKLYQGGVEVPGVVTTAGDLTAAAANTIAVTFIPNNEEQIAAGTSKTYELKATNVSGTVTAGKYITTSITNPSVTKIASAPFAKYLTLAPTLRYVDASTDATGGTVAAADVRQSPTVSVVSAYVQTDDGVVTFDTSDDTDEILSYGTVATGSEIILTETGADTSVIGPITGSLVTAGFTCTAHNSNDGTGAAVTALANLQSIKCVNATTTSQVILRTTPIAANDATVQITTITLTTATYAVGSVVGANDSDLGLEFAAGTQAAHLTASFIWSDLSAQSHSIVTSDWATDYLVKTLPTDAQTLTGQG
ncbi:MAG: hypothetical protein PHO90_02165 [Candidatus Pacebacteria bacterium]|nr:hypothetical protein [Candidatus Paceibacterota bacterium]